MIGCARRGRFVELAAHRSSRRMRYRRSRLCTTRTAACPDQGRAARDRSSRLFHRYGVSEARIISTSSINLALMSPRSGRLQGRPRAALAPWNPSTRPQPANSPGRRNFRAAPPFRDKEYLGASSMTLNQYAIAAFAALSIGACAGAASARICRRLGPAPGLFLQRVGRAALQLFDLGAVPGVGPGHGIALRVQSLLPRRSRPGAPAALLSACRPRASPLALASTTESEGHR